MFFYSELEFGAKESPLYNFRKKNPSHFNLQCLFVHVQFEVRDGIVVMIHRGKCSAELNLLGFAESTIYNNGYWSSNAEFLHLLLYLI